MRFFIARSTLLFLYTENFYIALMARFFIGAGSAIGFLGVSKVVSEWFLKKHYARMIGFSFIIGLMGAIYGGKPVSLLIETYSCQNVGMGLAIISLSIGFGALSVLRSPTQQKILPSDQFKIVHFKKLLASPVFWILAISNLLMVGSLEGFADVWGVPYLMTAYSLKKSEAAGLISLIFFGMLFGGPVLACLSEKIGNYSLIILCGSGMALAFGLLLSCESYHQIFLSFLFFCIGILCCYQVIVFAAGADLIEPQYMGVTIAFLNCINMLGGSFFHTSIGRLMDLFWNGTLNDEGLRVYTLQDYQYALSLIPICAIAGSGLICIKVL